MKKIMIVFGTRSEAIKMCLLVNELKKTDGIQTVACVAGQHREMLKQVLDIFSVTADYDLSIMKENQALFEITIQILTKIKKVFNPYGDGRACKRTVKISTFNKKI